ncbi:HNH endonuclease [Qingshengfaniella alkalisoli]|uniref:Putative HNH nuclease YajD n=1 Tax=Qingshengfaniella alkalisoli TaxID=2599296 RepID=A0A5B8J5P0_9RHOB|nr:HNH endonuclease signature motif containing protein [Qingshengfaniella alkalisoli]QDY69807.1 HNH endonuclease [Qingshengfaniella alkalisoli]
MGVMREHRRHSRAVTKSRRWKAMRMQALERDGWQCVRCGERRRLEVDHIEPVRNRPDLSYTLSNLQTLCGRCHARKTRIEVGMGQPNPAREAWKSLLREMQRKPIEERKRNA